MQTCLHFAGQLSACSQKLHGSPTELVMFSSIRLAQKKCTTQNDHTVKFTVKCTNVWLSIHVYICFHCLIRAFSSSVAQYTMKFKSGLLFRILVLMNDWFPSLMDKFVSFSGPSPNQILRENNACSVLLLRIFSF